MPWKGLSTLNSIDAKTRTSNLWERAWPWSRFRLRRRALRRISAWAENNRRLVQSLGLATFTFRNDGEVLVQARNGLWLRYLPELKRSALGVERTGEWEPQETQLVLDRLRPEGVFLDIGANCGWFTMCAARKFPSLTVHAFEPVPQTFDTLCFNVAANELANIRLNNVGLWDSPSELRFTRSLGPMNHISNDPREDCVSVKCVELDQYVAQANLARVDLIKCDVEGAELHVLKGAKQTLTRFRPVVLLETEDRLTKSFGYDSAEVVQFLLDIGYRYSVVSESGLRPASDRIEADLGLGRDLLFEKS